MNSSKMFKYFKPKFNMLFKIYMVIVFQIFLKFIIEAIHLKIENENILLEYNGFLVFQNIFWYNQNVLYYSIYLL